jgi:hypothetical protein
MRRLALALAAFAVVACSSPCQDLGDRLCRCAGVGTTRDACKESVKKDLDRLDPSKDVEDLCEERLDTCHAPGEAEFCEWLDTGDAIADACG